MAAGWATGYETTEAQQATVTSWLLTRADPRPGDVVLDIAAGSGGLSHAASRRVAPNGRVIETRPGVDAAQPIGCGSRHIARDVKPAAMGSSAITRKPWRS